MNIEMWPLHKLIPYEKNAKIHTDEQIGLIAHAISYQGWDQPIVVDNDGVIIKGHGRRLAAIRLGLEKVPVFVNKSLTKEQADAARISDNKLPIGAFDEPILREEMRRLVKGDDGLDSIDLGYTDEEVMGILGAEDDVDAILAQGSDDYDDLMTVTPTPKDPTPVEYTPAFQVVVQCEDEIEQETVYKLLTEQGYKVRVQSM